MLKLKISKNSFIIFSLVLTGGSFSGCFFSNKKVEAQNIEQTQIKKYPDWYSQASNSNLDNNEIYYGLGESSTELDSVAQALNSIASRISIEVASTYKSHTTLSNNIGNRDLSLAIEQSIKKIEFNNYKIVKSEIFNNNYLVKVAVNKFELGENLERKINLSFDEVKRDFNKNFANQIEKLKKSNELLFKLEKIKSELSIIKNINPSFNINKFIENINNLENEIIKFKNFLAFKVNGDENFKTTFKKFLNERGYVTKDHFTKSNDYKFIDINLNIYKDRIIIFGKFVLKVSIQIEFKDGQQTILGEKIIVSGKSSGDINKAEEFARKDFELKLNQSKIIGEIFKY